MLAMRWGQQYAPRIPSAVAATTMTIDTRLQTLAFSIENAFTDRLGGGNPAAIVHVPSLQALPDATLQTVAANFNQPITVFVAPKEAGTAQVPTFGIRWFTPSIEAPLCGHGTLAAGAALLALHADAQAIRFEATSGKHLIARRAEEGRVEIDLDSERAEALKPAEDTKLRGVLARALGKDVPVKYTGHGVTHLHMYALAEVDTLDLKNIKVDVNAFRDSSFLVHVIVAPSLVPGVAFESRMFAPSAGLPEDPVCGTAHTLSTPYWMDANSLSGAVFAKQVSERGGDLRVLLDSTEGRIKLAGEVRTVSKGELYA
ncbi:hypothetical protein BC834DRAFT_906539 [Gloeopeniophorella convolvens]|nr:hypothetical protein BC834DRAFT_906539 [Gloeopeniophorella convolvens]